MKEETVILSPRDIMEILKISLQTAYKIINELNIELEEINRKRKSEGKLPYIIFRAKIYRKYFYERYNGKKFLKINEIEKKFKIKEWEAKKISSDIKKELEEKGFKVIKGRVSEEYLLEKMI